MNTTQLNFTNTCDDILRKLFPLLGAVHQDCLESAWSKVVDARANGYDHDVDEAVNQALKLVYEMLRMVKKSKPAFAVLLWIETIMTNYRDKEI